MSEHVDRFRFHRTDLAITLAVLKQRQMRLRTGERASDVFSLRLKFIHADNQKSRREWRKHQAANFYVTPRQIEFRAKFSDFFEEKALRDTLEGIEHERKDCMDFLGQRRESGTLSLAIDAPIQFEIQSEGYFYEEFRFRLEYAEIISLLMGTKLYRDERVFIRELLQNSLDACRQSKQLPLLWLFL